MNPLWVKQAIIPGSSGFLPKLNPYNNNVLSNQAASIYS
jgi:hypothetical protein